MSPRIVCPGVDLHSAINLGTRWALSVWGNVSSGSEKCSLIIIINFLLFHFLSFYFWYFYSGVGPSKLASNFIFYIFHLLTIFCFLRDSSSFIFQTFYLNFHFCHIINFQVFFFGLQILFLKEFWFCFMAAISYLVFVFIFVKISSPILPLSSLISFSSFC